MHWNNQKAKTVHDWKAIKLPFKPPWHFLFIKLKMVPNLGDNENLFYKYVCSEVTT